VQNFNLYFEGKKNFGASVLGEIHQMDVKKELQYKVAKCLRVAHDEVRWRNVENTTADCRV